MEERQLKQIKRRIYVHPRVQYQGLPTISMENLLERMPGLVPFPGKEYHSFIFILDWDHRLPSTRLFGRLLAFYDPKAEQRALREYKLRFREISAKDLFPEFDVHDFDDILADESYLYLFLPGGIFRKVQLLSPWRHNVAPEKQAVAVECVKKNNVYAELAEQYGSRCGALRVIGWVPPCMSRKAVWTIDVRYVTYCETSSIWGKMFLVDPLAETILSVSDFNMRV